MQKVLNPQGNYKGYQTKMLLEISISQSDCGDMTLFQTWGVTPQEHAFVIENILLFVPFGVLFPLAVAGSKNGDGRAVDRLSKCTVLFGFLCSVCIETVQLITERGYCQLDDVVMNTLGSLAGYIIFLIIKKMKNIKKMEE